MKISIIIPAYNAERYVDRCFESVYSDGLPEEHFEVIAVNDGSKDNTVDVLRSWCDKHKNITLIDKENEGVSVARNVAIDAAQGEYVLFLDVDDGLVSGALAKVYNYLEEHEPMDMLVTRQLRNDGTKEWLALAPSLEEHRVYDGVAAYKSHYVRTNAGGGICRREFLNNHNLTFPAGIKNAEDTIFFGHLQVYAKSIVYYDLSLYRIYEAENSASRTPNYTKLAQSHVKTLRAVAEVKKSLKERKESKAIFDYVVYQLLSNTIAYFVCSKELSYSIFKKEIETKSLLPIDTENMLMRNKAKVMNISIPLFYFLSWVIHK